MNVLPANRVHPVRLQTVLESNPDEQNYDSPTQKPIEILYQRCSLRYERGSLVCKLPINTTPVDHTSIQVVQQHTDLILYSHTQLMPVTLIPSPAFASSAVVPASSRYTSSLASTSPGAQGDPPSPWFRSTIITFLMTVEPSDRKWGQSRAIVDERMDSRVMVIVLGTWHLPNRERNISE